MDLTLWATRSFAGTPDDNILALRMTRHGTQDDSIVIRNARPLEDARVRLQMLR